MTKNRFDIQWIGHCAAMNVVWGWLRDTDDSDRNHYVFYAHIGKTITLKKFPRYSRSQIDMLIKRKKNNHYNELKYKDLIAIWPNFMIELENKFTFDKLAERI